MSLKDVNQEDDTFQKIIQLWWIHTQQFFADDAFGLISMRRFIVVLFEGDDKL